jgi:multiple sugar transport system ATP-binding protein
MASLRLQDLTKDFGKLRAVNNISLEVADGEFIVILGPSGAGKTTTLKMIAGAETPTSGQIYIGDKLVNSIEPFKRNVAMAFESYALYPHFTVRDNLSFPLRAPAVKMPEAEITKRVNGVAETLNIHMLLDRLPQHLSNGQKQRVALGRAMVREPDILMLDEPISHLDAKLRHRMRTEFKALEATLRYTTIYVTHDYLEALSLGDRLAVLNKGEIQQIGLPHELFVKPANVFVSQILGHPQVNLLGSSISNRDGDLIITSDDGSVSVRVPDSLRPGLERLTDDKALLGIRPLHMQVSSNGDGTDSNTCKGVVYVYERLGTKGILTASVGKNMLSIITPIEREFKIDENISITVDPESILIFDPESQKNVLFL